MGYWSAGIMEYGVKKRSNLDFKINDIDPPNPSFHRSMFPLFRF
jgi:hypothetical protein